jgi:hypothetical protein
MRIRFGIDDNNELLSTYYAGAIIFLVLFQIKSLDILHRSQESVFMLRMPNVTSVEPHLYYGIPYNDCHCSIVSTKYCITDTELKISRILPLILFVLQIYLIREALSLSGDHIYFFVYVLWIVSTFIFIGILVIIYRYNSYYEYTVSILCVTGCLLFSFVGYEVGLDGYKTRSSRNNAIVVNDERSIYN